MGSPVPPAPQCHVSHQKCAYAASTYRVLYEVNESDACCSACVGDEQCVGWALKTVGANDPWCMLSTSEQVSGCLEEPCYPCGVVQRGPMPAPVPSPTPVPTPSQTTTTTPASPPPMPTPVPPSPVPVSTYVCTDNQC